MTDHGLFVPRQRPEIPGDAPQTVAAILDSALSDHPDRLALIGRYSRYTFAELDLSATREAGALHRLGVRVGDRVAASLPNHPDIIVLFLACMRLGAMWLGINRALARPEKAYLLRDADVAVYLADPDGIAQLRGETIEGLRHAVLVDPTSFKERGLMDAPTPAPANPIDPFAPAAIAYTSGTTGFPKGAVHSQHNLVLPGAISTAIAGDDLRATQGVCLPLTVLNLMVLGPCVTLQRGAPLVCMDRIDPIGMAEWIRDERIETFSAVPAMVHGLLTHPDVTEEHLASLTRPGVGGADLPEAFRDLYRDRFGSEVTIGYGLTEAPTAVSVTDPSSPPIPDEAGVALPQVELRILDENGEEAPAGEVGEICVAAASSGPWANVYTPMLGYWNQPDATAEALRGDVLHTGDLGYVDRDGHLFVKDRRNDLIIRGGANVYPAEVERVLHADPRVHACAVVGAPDEHYGEIVTAFVQPADGIGADDDLRTSLETDLHASLAAYKVPERWEWVDDFERTPMGKIRKGALRERL